METTNKKRLNPTPEPAHAPSSAIQSISNRFRKLGMREQSAPSISHSILTKSSSMKEEKKVASAKLNSSSSGGGKKGDSKQIGSELDSKETRRISLSSTIPSPLGGGGRRSLWSSSIELADFFSSSGAKSVAVDMPPFMQIHAVDCARRTHDSLEKFTSKTLALTLKKEFDGVYGPAWHCIVGTSFGSFVTHSVGGFLYFSLDHKLHILLFKTSVQRAAQ